ncbi:MAG: BatA and WFA domain-containing protein [Verrucomicrobiota bacterium]
MEFLRPEFLWLLLLGVVPVLLYLFRRKSKQVNVSTLVFFKTLAREHQESAWLRRLKKWLSFLLTALVIAAAVFGLSRLVRKGGDDSFRTVVILLDRSASMGMTDSGGQSRLAAARADLIGRLEAIPDDVGVALIAYDSRPEIIQPRTLVRRELISRLNDVQVRSISGDVESALSAAQVLAALETPATIWHASDSAITEPPLVEDVSFTPLTYATEAPVNAAITSFQVRPTPLENGSFDVHVQVALNHSAPEPQDVKLELSIGGMISQFRDLTLEAGQREQFSFKIRGAGGQILRVDLKCEQDRFSVDDRVLTPLPKTDPVLVVWIRDAENEGLEDPYVSLALRSIQEEGTLQLLKGTSKNWPLKDPVDAVIFDGWLPDEWPSDIPAVVINPPRAVGPVLAKRLSDSVPFDSVRVGNEDHPVLFRVSSSRVALTQTAVFQTSGSLEPLWLAGNEPVLAAGEVGGQRLVVMGFSPAQSEQLPLTASFPLLIGNAVLWSVSGGTELNAFQTVRSTGGLLPVDDSEITWTTVEKGMLKERSLPVSSSTIELDRSGIWRTPSGDEGAAFLLSANESDLPAIAPADSGSTSGASTRVSKLGNITRILLLIIVLVLLVESYLFHRHAVY